MTPMRMGPTGFEDARDPIPAAEYEALRREAYEAHSAALAEARATARGPLIVTCDMCLCGQSTGLYKAEACRALQQVRPA